jgi:hypothetical protein
MNTPNTNSEKLNEEILKDPAVRRALEKAARKKEKAARKKEVQTVGNGADPATGERILVKAETTDQMSPRERKKIEQAAAAEAQAIIRAENKLVKRTFLDVTDVRSTVRNLNMAGYGHFLLKDGSHMEILRTRGRSLTYALDDEIEICEGLFMELIRRCTVDFKLIALNTPLNTKPYQEELEMYIRQTDNPAYQEMLQENIEQFQAMDAQTIQRQLFVMLFAPDIEGLMKTKRYFNMSPIPVIEMTLEQQERTLEKIYNLPRIIDI